MLQAAAKLDRKHCTRLALALRRRINALAEAPDPILARNVRTSKTATITLKEQDYTGVIVDRASLTVVLKFSDDVTLCCSIAALEPSGFNRDLTASPDYLNQQVPSATPITTLPTVMHRHGSLYAVEHITGSLAQVKRLIPGPSEAMPSQDLQPLGSGGSIEL